MVVGIQAKREIDHYDNFDSGCPMIAILVLIATNLVNSKSQIRPWLPGDTYEGNVSPIWTELEESTEGTVRSTDLTYSRSISWRRFHKEWCLAETSIFAIYRGLASPTGSKVVTVFRKPDGDQPLVGMTIKDGSRMTELKVVGKTKNGSIELSDGSLLHHSRFGSVIEAESTLKLKRQFLLNSWELRGWADGMAQGDVLVFENGNLFLEFGSDSIYVNRKTGALGGFTEPNGLRGKFEEFSEVPTKLMEIGSNPPKIKDPDNVSHQPAWIKTSATL